LKIRIVKKYEHHETVAGYTTELQILQEEKWIKVDENELKKNAEWISEKDKRQYVIAKEREKDYLRTRMAFIYEEDETL
jgi:hypothetical protein